MSSNKNIFILGAGFSKPAGLPTISEFYNEIKRIYLDKRFLLNKFLQDCFKTVINYRNDLDKISSKTKIDLDNIEILFSYLDMDCKCSGDTTLNQIRKKLIYTIINTLKICTNFSEVEEDNNLKIIEKYKGAKQLNYTEGRKKLKHSLNIFEYFATVVSGKIGDRDYQFNLDDSIITFNYDLILDQIFLKQNIGVNYCLESNSKKGIKFLKLHGSANWLYCPKCKKVNIYKRGYLHKIKKCDNCKHDLEPLIVPPTWNKDSYNEKLNLIWEEAVNEIKQARRIFILGYSMPPTDMYFEFLMSLGLKNNSLIEKVYVVDILEEEGNKKIKNYLDTLKMRYEHFFNENFASRKFEFLPVGIINFINKRLYFDSLLNVKKS